MLLSPPQKLFWLPAARRLWHSFEKKCSMYEICFSLKQQQILNFLRELFQLFHVGKLVFCSQINIVEIRSFLCLFGQNNGSGLWTKTIFTKLKGFLTVEWKQLISSRKDFFSDSEESDTAACCDDSELFLTSRVNHLIKFAQFFLPHSVYAMRHSTPAARITLSLSALMSETCPVCCS